MGWSSNHPPAVCLRLAYQALVDLLQTLASTVWFLALGSLLNQWYLWKKTGVSLPFSSSGKMDTYVYMQINKNMIYIYIWILMKQNRNTLASKIVFQQLYSQGRHFGSQGFVGSTKKPHSNLPKQRSVRMESSFWILALSSSSSKGGKC